MTPDLNIAASASERSITEDQRFDCKVGTWDLSDQSLEELLTVRPMTSWFAQTQAIRGAK